MFKKHPVLILMFILMATLSFAATVDVSHEIFNADGQPEQIAHIGSTIKFTATVETVDQGTIVNGVVIECDTLFGIDNDFVLSLSRLGQYTYTGDYLVTAGLNENDQNALAYTAIATINGGFDLFDQGSVLVNNIIYPVIDNPLSTWIDTPNPVSKVGDEITFKLDRSQNVNTTNVVTVTIDLSSIGGPVDAEAVLNGEIFSYAYTLTETSLQGGYIADIVVPITMTNANNISSDNNDARNIIDGRTQTLPYVPVPADTQGPDISNISDLQYDDQYRFSSDTDDDFGWATDPNTIKAKIEIPGFGVGGNISQFVVRFDNENVMGDTPEYVTYNTTNTTIDGNFVKFEWDGILDGQLVSDAIYGLTLVSVADPAGNSVGFNALPPIANPVVANGNTELNKLDLVVDNAAPIFENIAGNASPLMSRDISTDAERLTIARNINEANNDPANVGIFDGADIVTSIDQVYFTFDVERDFTNDTEPGRREFVTYWFELENQDSSIKRYFYNGVGLEGDADVNNLVKMDAFDHNDDTNAHSTINTKTTMSWQPSMANFPAGVYSLSAFVQDNAGNVNKSTKEINVQDIFGGYIPPPVAVDASHITGFDVTTRHDGGNNGLPEVDNSNNPIFYIDSYDAQNELYFSSQNETIKIEIEISHPENASRVIVRRNNMLLPAGFDEVFTSNLDQTLSVEVPVSDFDESLTGYFTYGNSTSDIEILVETRNFEEDPYDVDNYASLTKQFKIEKPAEPTWPAINSDIQVTPYCISPGNPADSYDSVTNPANESDLTGVNSNPADVAGNTIEFDVTAASVAYAWELKVYDPASPNVIKSTNGTQQPADGALNSSLNFYNLSDDYQQIVGTTDTQVLTVELSIDPDGLEDTGYVAPEEFSVFASTKVDNENPQFLGMDNNHYLPEPTGNDYFVTNTVNSFELDVNVSEYLLEEGWSGVVYDESDFSLVPGAVVNITATGTGTSQICPNDITKNVYQSFTLNANIQNLNEGTRYTLVLRTPNDLAGNPGRVNNPAYPYDGDNWWNDSSEAFVHFIKLNNSAHDYPVLTNFYYINEDGDEVLNKAQESGSFRYEVYFNNYFNTRSVTQEAMNVEFSLNLISADYSQPIVQQVGGVYDGYYKWVWTGTYDGFTESYVTGDSLTIEFSSDLGFSQDDDSVHDFTHTDRSVVVDLTDPVITENSVPTSVDENNNLTLVYEITDADSGVQSDQVKIVCSDNTLIADNTVANDLGNDLYQWIIAIPADYDANTLTFTVTAKDMVDNETSTTADVDITAIPTVANVLVYNADPQNDNIHSFEPGIVEDGNKVNVNFDLTDIERIDAVSITLYTDDNNNVKTEAVALASIVEGNNTIAIEDVATTGLNQYSALRAKVEITHNYVNNLDNSFAESNNALLYPFIDDAQIVVEDIKFFVNGVESLNNEISSEMADQLVIEATLVAYDGMMDVNDVTLNYNTFVADAPIQVSSIFESTPVDSYPRNTFVYRWTNEDFNYDNFVRDGWGWLNVNFTLDVKSTTNFTTSYDEEAVAVAVQDIPTVANVEIHNATTTQHNDKSNHVDMVQDGNKVVVNYDLTDADRIDQVTVYLNNGESFIDNNFANGNNTFEIDNFGAGQEYATLRVDSLVISHPQEYQVFSSSDLTDVTLDVPFVDNNQVVITDFRFYVNGTETQNYFTADENQDFEVQVDVVAYDGHVDADDIALEYKDILAGNATLVNTVLDSEPVTGFVRNTYTYAWYQNAQEQDFDYSQFDVENGFENITFKANVTSNFNFIALEQAEEAVVIETPTFIFHGISPDRYTGMDPEGWFAPEHNVKLEMTIHSIIDDQAFVAEANFDQITDDFPDTRWVLGTVVSNMINDDVFPVWEHVVTWVETPDVASCWNAYDDGEEVQVQVRYEDFFAVNPITLNRGIKVDLEVPVYEDYSIAQGASDLTYAQAKVLADANTPVNQSQRNNFDLTLNDPNNLDSYFFDGSIYIKRIINDHQGVSILPSAVADISAIAGWTVEVLGSEAETDHTLTMIWKLTPNAPVDVENTDVINVQFNSLEDLVNHENYVGEDYYSPSNKYAAAGPVVEIGFISSDADVQGVVGFQYDGNDRLNSASSKFVSAGNEIGLILDIEPQANDNATINSVEILADTYNGANGQWVTLASNGVTANGDFEYYLNSDITLDAATPVGPLSLTYRITYSTGEVRQATVANVYDVIDITSTELIALDVWSETLGKNSMNYVTPNDTDAHIRLKFRTPTTISAMAKPVATFTDFENVLDVNGPIVSNDADLTYDSANDIWTAEITGLTVRANHQVANETSQLVHAFVTTITGLNSPSSDSFIEFAGEGPLVPIIRHAELVTSGLMNNQADVVNVIALDSDEFINPVLNVYIDCQYQEYIDNVTVGNVNGLTFGDYTVTDTNINNSQWLVTFPVTVDRTQFTEGQSFDILVNSIRNPFELSATVFNHEYNVENVMVDGNDFDITINPIATQNPTMGNFEFSFDLENFGENANLNYVPELTDIVISSPLLVNDLNPAQIINGVGSLTIDAADFTPAAASEGSVEFTVTYKNIYGFTKAETINVLLDATAPIVSTNGFEFVTDNNVYSYVEGANINIEHDWSSIRLYLEDPTMFGTTGVGIANVVFDLELGDVTPETPAYLARRINAFNGQFIEVAFNNFYTSHDLAEGRYLLTYTVTDALGNVYNSSQEFVNTYEQADVTPVSNVADLNSGEDVDLEYYISDDLGIVNNVEFEIYYDEDNDGEWEDEAVLPGNPNMKLNPSDNVYPYGFTWNLSDDFYTQYLDNANYPNTNVRNYFVRVLVTSSTMRTVTEYVFPYTVADVTAPVVTDIFADGLNNKVQVYDYTDTNYAVNNIDFTALCTNWADAASVELTVNGDVLVYDFTNPVIWNFDVADMGIVNISAVATDIVGNQSIAYDFTGMLEIQNPSYDKSYALELKDYEDFNVANDTDVPAIYSPNSPVTNNSVKLLATYPNGLHGISQIEFYYDRTDNLTGNVETFDLTNNVTINPDFGNSNVINSDQCYYDQGNDLYYSWITVDESIYTNGNNTAGTDYSYRFYAVMIDTYTNVAVISDPAVVNVDETLRVDFASPVLTYNTASTSQTSWSEHNNGNDIIVVNYSDVDAIDPTLVNVKINNVDVADNNNIIVDALANTITIPWTGVNTLALEGNVTYEVTVTDINGNISAVENAVVYIDNQAPETVIANIAYSTDEDHGGAAVSQLTPYNGTDEIWVLESQDENLTIQIDRAAIAGLSSTDTDTWADRTQPWYDNTQDDIYPPVQLYSNVDGNGWIFTGLYDHEVDANNMYQFDISVNNANRVEYAVIALDTRGNIEGDVIPFDGIIDNYQIDIAVNVIPVADLTTNIFNHADGDHISGLEVLTANVAQPAIVQEMRFEYLDDVNGWTTIAPIDNDSQVIDYTFEVSSETINYPVIPGVHVILTSQSGNNDVRYELEEANGLWTIEETLPADVYDINYYVDMDNNGIIEQDELNNHEIAAVAKTIDVTDYAVQFDTRTFDVDGEYQFRAVAVDNAVATVDENFANIRTLVIDNTAPQFTVTDVRYDDIQGLKVDEKDFDFSVNYDNINDIKNVYAYLVDSANTLFPIVNVAYGAYDTPATDFAMDLTDPFTNIVDGVYDLRVKVVDFAGNDYTVDYANVAGIGSDIHVDVTDPVVTNIASTNTGLYNITHTFTVNYTDYLASLGAVGSELGVKSFEATFTHGTTVDAVNVKTSDNGAQLTFDWTPSQEMQSYIVNGMNNLNVDIAVTVTDHNDHQSAIFNAAQAFVLEGEEPGARIMVVSDLRNNVETYHQTDVETNSVITDMVGNNILDLYAFIPEGNNVIVPTSVSAMISRDNGLTYDAAFDNVGSLGNNPAVIALVDGYDRYFKLTLDASTFTEENVIVKTISQYPFGQIENETSMTIYRDHIAPSIHVTELTDANVDINAVNRGTHYNVSIDGSDNYYLNAVTYKYRYLDADGNIASDWNEMFVTANGNTHIKDLNNENWHVADWNVGLDFLYATAVQIAPEVEDIFGNTESVTDYIVNQGSYYQVNIVDVAAPVVSNITVAQNGNAILADSWTNDENDIDVAVTVNNTVLDLLNVTATFNGTEFINQSYTTNDQTNLPVVNGSFAVAGLATGNYTFDVVTTDFVGHTETMTFSFNIDNDVPAGNLVLAENDNGYIERGMAYTFQANATDNQTADENITITYWWSEAGLDTWTQLVLDAEGKWTIPAAFAFNTSYDFKAVMTDEYVNTSESIVTYQVRDNETTIAISQINTMGVANGLHINGNINLDLTVNNTDVDEINVYVVRPGQTDWSSLGQVAVVNGIASYLFTPADTDVDGEYRFGFGPLVRFEDIQVEITVVLDRMVDITLPADAVAGITNDSIFNENSEIDLAFTVDADEVFDANIELQYANVLDGRWMTLATVPATVNNTDVAVTFAGLNAVIVNSGFYNFQAIVRDTASPVNEQIVALASNVYFDNSAPVISFSNITDGTEFELGTVATINAEAIYTDDTNSIVPTDIDNVEFFVNNVSMAVVEAAPFTFDWNTAVENQVGTYEIKAIVTDNDAYTNVVTQDVFVVTPNANDPYAVITGFEFNNEQISSDKMYAMVNRWGNSVTSVTAEYSINGEWTEFAVDQTNGDPYYEFDFNAEAIAAATQIKVNVVMNNGQESSRVFPINVTYVDGEFTFDTANGSIEIYDNSMLKVVDTASMANVVRIDENGFAGYHALDADNMMPLVVNNNNELPSYWLSGIDNGNAWISYVELPTQMGIATLNGATVDYDNPFWFVMTETMPVDDIYNELTDQVKVQSTVLPAGDAVYTLPVTGTVAEQGNIVALVWDAVAGNFVEADVEYNQANNEMTFTAPVNTVVTVGQYVGFELNLTSINPVSADVYEVNGDTWTLSNPSFSMNVYHEMVDGAYDIFPAFALANVNVLVDGVNTNVANLALNNSIIDFDLANLTAGAHDVLVNVEMNGFTASANLTINVDDTLPTVMFDTAIELDALNRTLTATIQDTETGIMDYNLVINNFTAATMINVPMDQITVAGDQYSYELSIEELVTLVPQPMRSREIATLNVAWTAVNNLNQVNVIAGNVIANVTVDRPVITFLNTGFENGWWLNPSMSQEFIFTVVPAEGRTIEDIEVVLSSIDDNNNANVIQTSTPVATANPNEYSFSFVQLQLPNAIGLKVEIDAIDDIDVNNIAEQTFGIDYAQPIVMATSPIGNPIDNDNDGLFNEDPINGINEDQDFDDANNNGVWDLGEVAKIDEDIIDFENAEIMFGTDAQLAFEFEDLAGIYVNSNVQYYTGASGINLSSLVVTLDGTDITADGTSTAGAFAYTASDLTPGMHTAVATISDLVGNTGTSTLSFEVVGGPTPVVEFNNDDNNWWISTTTASTFNMNVVSGHDNTEITSVVANIYQEPANEVVQGPITLSLDDNGDASINFHGSVVEAGQTAVRVEVIAMNGWNLEAAANQTYPIDNERPLLSIINPVNEYTTMLGNAVNVTVQAQDNLSGLASTRIKVIAPNGMAIADSMITEDADNLQIAVTPEESGTYIVQATSKDMVGNVTNISRNFTVSAPAPIITIDGLDMSNGWVNVTSNNEIAFDIDNNGSEINSVMASVIAIPSNEVIVEPYTVANNNGYAVNLHGGIIPTDASAVKVVVSAENIAGGFAEATQTYPIDAYCPTIEFVTPEVNTVFAQDENLMVDVLIELSDIMPVVEDDTTRVRANSGLDSLVIVATNAANEEVLNLTVENVANSYACRVPAQTDGQYLVAATIYDRAGNKTVKMITFQVEADYSGVNLEFTAKPYMYPSPMLKGDMATFVIPTTKEAKVTIEIFDFAGKLVRTIAHNSIGGDMNNKLEFDGRTSGGKRLARGAYFARIRVVDGAKEISKVVKIAIK